MLAAQAATESVTICLEGEPRGKGRPRFRVIKPHGGAQFVSTYTDAATRNYENDLRIVAKQAMRGREKFSGPVLVKVIARMPIPVSWPKSKQSAAVAGHVRPTGKPDADNVLKVLDALNDIAWHDDSQIVSAFISKVYSDHPALVIEVRGMPAEAPSPMLFAESIAERAP